MLPDPPSETISLLRANGVRAIIGSGDLYRRDWNTARRATTLAQRRRRPDPPDRWLPDVASGQPALDPDDVAWLRTLPADLVLDGGRPGDVSVCPGKPGNPFSTVRATDPRFASAFTPEGIRVALSSPGVAGAGPMLCGHAPGPLVPWTPLPSGRMALVARG